MITTRKIQQCVADHFRILVDDLTRPGRSSEIANIRHIAVWLCRRLTDHSLPEIGRAFCRDHSTIHSSVSRGHDLSCDPNWQPEIEAIRQMINVGEAEFRSVRGEFKRRGIAA